MLESSGRIAQMTHDEVLSLLKKTMQGNNFNDDVYLQDHFESFISSIQKTSTRHIYSRTLSKLNEFCHKNISFYDIDVAWLKDFEIFLLRQGLKINGVSIHMRNLRAVLNDAINRKVVTNYEYPFKIFKIKNEPTTKRDLSFTDIRVIRDWPEMRKYLDIFMLSFYLGGINIGDLCQLRDSNFYNGRIVYRRQKTSGDPISILVQPEAMEIIEKYKGQQYLLNILDKYNSYKTFLRRMDRALKTFGPYEVVAKGKKIRHPLYPFLSTYYARHTFATLASEELDIPEDIIGRILGHSDKTVTGIYIHKKNRKADDALRKVLDALKNSENYN